MTTFSDLNLALERLLIAIGDKTRGYLPDDVRNKMAEGFRIDIMKIDDNNKQSLSLGGIQAIIFLNNKNLFRLCMIKNLINLALYKNEIILYAKEQECNNIIECLRELAR